MGCDIHAHVEVKINGEWHHYSALNLDRNYLAFAKMADVRNDGEVVPIAARRGIPDDATFLTKFDADHWGLDAHSHSWLTDEEVGVLAKFMNEEMKKYRAEWWNFEHHWFGYLFSNGYGYVKSRPGDYPVGVEDARVIFWFDN